MLRAGDLQMLNMQIAGLHSERVQCCVQIRHKDTPTVVLLGIYSAWHQKSVPPSSRIVWLFPIAILHLGFSVEPERNRG